MNDVIPKEVADKLLHVINSLDEIPDKSSELDLVLKAARTLLHEQEKGTFQDAEKWRAHLQQEASKMQACSAWAEDKTFWEDAKRYRKIKRISQGRMGIDIFESDGVVDLFHTGLESGHKAPSFDQAIDEVVE